MMDMPAPLDLAALFRTEGIEVEADPSETAILSADIAGPAAEPAQLVLRPSDASQVQRIVQLARREHILLFPRGGGWSYTGGFRPHGVRSALVDTARLQDIAIDYAAGTVVLRTMPVPPTTLFSSFDFPTGPTALGVLAGLAGLANLGEAYVFDPGTHANLAKTGFCVIEESLTGTVPSRNMWPGTSMCANTSNYCTIGSRPSGFTFSTSTSSW